MENKASKKLNIPMYIAGILLILVLFSACAMSGLYARYAATKSDNDNVNVAKMLFVGNETISTDLPSFPGDFVEYEFTVSNAKDGSVTDVMIDYTIKVSDFGNLPFNYEITCSDNNSIKNASLNDAGTFSGNGTMQAGVATTHHYTLKVTWDSTKNDSALADEIDCIKIIVDAKQVN